VTASGESLPGPLTAVSTGPVPLPAPVATDGTIDKAGLTPGSLSTGFWYQYAVTYVTAAGETTAFQNSAGFLGFGNTAFQLTSIPISPFSGVIARKVYRSLAQANSGTVANNQLFLLSTINDNTTSSMNDTASDASISSNANPPSVGTAGNYNANQVSLTGDRARPGREHAQSKGVPHGRGRIATEAPLDDCGQFLDHADRQHGGCVPRRERALLGHVRPLADDGPSAGRRDVLAAGEHSELTVGGWVVTGQQVIRYTGTSGNSLTGIPASGPGAITASILYGAAVQLAPSLIGIPPSGTASIRYAIAKGDYINLLVHEDDLAGQASHIGRYGGTGIVEDYSSDGRMGETEARARCLAKLAFAAQALTTVHYKCRDRKSFSGSTVHVDLFALQAFGDFLIQDVQIYGFHEVDDFYPTFEVTAASTRSTFEDLLRLTRKALVTAA
jgi:hypothetical protein